MKILRSGLGSPFHTCDVMEYGHYKMFYGSKQNLKSTNSNKKPFNVDISGTTNSIKAFTSDPVIGRANGSGYVWPLHFTTTAALTLG